MRYRTIVVDPPWHYGEGWPTLSTSEKRRPGIVVPDVPDFTRRKPLAYQTLSVSEIADLPVDALAAPDAHLYLWTTNRYLPDAFGVVAAWGFRYSQTLLWCKAPMGIGVGGAWQTNVEYVVFARRGNLRTAKRHDTCWWNWPRMGNAHSRKPDAFLDMVERVSPEPRLEMFARRQRLGWDTYGDECLQHVDLAPSKEAV